MEAAQTLRNSKVLNENFKISLTASVP